MHTPVLLQDSLDGLNIKPEGLYIDATVGEGGHLQEILKRKGKVLGIDQDAAQIENLRRAYNDNSNVVLALGNFADIEQIAKENGFYPVDGILFDLGLSNRQIENSGKGFSYKKLDEELDMRLDPKLTITAREIINTFDEKDLYEQFAHYSEDKNTKKIVHALTISRRSRPIVKVGELTRIIDSVLGGKDTRTYARIFQALRIMVNDELENIKKGFIGALSLIKNEGRIVVITFHSLEDRIAKQFILNNRLRQINKKVVLSKNRLSFERSAKLRIISR